MEKVMLIFPPFVQPSQSKKRCMVPLGIAYIGAYLRENGIDVKLLDCVVEGYDQEQEVGQGQKRFGLSFDEIGERITEYNPDFVGVSCLMTTQRNNALKVCEIAKQVNSKIHTVMGGCHPSVFSKETLAEKSVDTVVVGEGEQAMLEVVRQRKKGIIQKQPIDINTLPFPARDLLPMERYLKINMPENIFSPYNRVTQIVTSRGCPFKCVFCATTNFHGKWRGRTAKSVIDEVRLLKEKYDVEEINIIDENLVFDKQRTLEIMKGFMPLNIAWSNPGGIWVDGLDREVLAFMKSAGCYQLTFPVETTNIKILHDVINKPLHVDKVKPLVDYCHLLNIDVHAFFVCGFPEQTKQDMINDFEYAKNVNFDSASFHIITPLPGSRIYEEYKDIVDLNKINYIKVTIPHPEIPDTELEQLVHSFNVKFNKRLLWKHPYKFLKKYVGTSIKKFSIFDVNKMFQRV